MSNIKKGQLTATGRWAKHLRKVFRRAFWKGERQTGKKNAKKEVKES